MSDFVVKRTFPGILATGLAATAICLIVACVYWPVWGTIMKAVGSSLAGAGLKTVDPKVAAKYYTVLAEWSFFWMVITAWIWQTLLMGNYGKTYLTVRQPWAGLWYTVVGFVTGIIGFLVITCVIGGWWKPFSPGILFTPQNAHEVAMAIEGFEAGNFFALVGITVQIPLVALFHKWPFAGNAKPPFDSLAVLMTSLFLATIVWIAHIVPSFMKLSLDGQVVTAAPMGSFPTYVAFCQCYVFWMLIGAEGGEMYPSKLFAKKQPYMGLAGLAIALVCGYGTLQVVRPFIASLNLMPGAPVDLLVASFVLSIILVQLLWHHLFDDYPTAQMMSNQPARILIRIAIWVVVGSIVGILWIKNYKLLPFAGNDLGMGFPVMGLLAGQFAFMMVYLYMNTFFDKWPLVRKVPVEQSSQTSAKA